MKTRRRRLPHFHSLGRFPVRFSHSSPIAMTVYRIGRHYFIIGSGCQIPVIQDGVTSFRAVEIQALDLPPRLRAALIRQRTSLIEDIEQYLGRSAGCLRGVGTQGDRVLTLALTRYHSRTMGRSGLSAALRAEPSAGTLRAPAQASAPRLGDPTPTVMAPPGRSGGPPAGST